MSVGVEERKAVSFRKGMTGVAKREVGANVGQRGSTVLLVMIALCRCMSSHFAGAVCATASCVWCGRAVLAGMCCGLV